MLTGDIVAYLATASLGLTPGVNLWAEPLPETTSTTDYQVSVVEYGGRPSIRGMGANLSAPVAEIRRFQVAVIGQQSQNEETGILANSIYKALDQLAEVSLGSTGTRYLLIRALQPPFYFPPGDVSDQNAQHHFTTNFEAHRERA